MTRRTVPTLPILPEAVVGKQIETPASLGHRSRALEGYKEGDDPGASVVDAEHAVRDVARRASHRGLSNENLRYKSGVSKLAAR